MKISIYKNEVIPVYCTELGNKVVIASELYKFLSPDTRFNDWIKRKIKEHGLVENQDYAFYSNLSSKKTRGGHNKKDFVIRLHAGKKIALGTNNEAGDKIKDYFIKCEEIVNRITTSESFDPSHYIGKENQKQLVKNVSGVLYAQKGECSDLIKHHQDNCSIHFSVTPTQLRKECVKKGMRVKSKSAREIARIIKPEAACSMAVHDDFVAQGHTLDKLKEVQLREKLEPAFKVVMELGFTPKHLLK